MPPGRLLPLLLRPFRQLRLLRPSVRPPRGAPRRRRVRLPRGRLRARPSAGAAIAADAATARADRLPQARRRAPTHPAPTRRRSRSLRVFAKGSAAGCGRPFAHKFTLPAEAVAPKARAGKGTKSKASTFSSQPAPGKEPGFLFVLGRSQRRTARAVRVAGLRRRWLRPAGSASRSFCTFWWQKVPKTIRTSVSRVLRSSSLKRAPGAGLQANRPRFSTLGLRLGQTPLRPIVRSLSCRSRGRGLFFSARSRCPAKSPDLLVAFADFRPGWLRAAGSSSRYFRLYSGVHVAAFTSLIISIL